MKQLDWKAHRAFKGGAGLELYPENVKRQRGVLMTEGAPGY